MFGLRKIIPEKVVNARNGRSRPEIVKNANNKFTEQDLYNWEKGLNSPRPEKIPYLVKGLGVPLEEISEEISIEIDV